MGEPGDHHRSLFERCDLDESIDVRVARYDAGELSAVMEACSELPRARRVTIVAALPRAAHAAAARAAIARAGLLAHTLVVVTIDDDLERWGGLTPGDLRALARGFGDARVLLEPAPGRAVVGAMQWLAAGDTFAVLWPRDRDLPDPGALVRAGGAWRAAWDAPEDGEFHDAPRGIDGLPIRFPPDRPCGDDERTR
ncbi:MAG: hypothetical protein U0802_20460 [Candidatus Binatia bacterium]